MLVTTTLVWLYSIPALSQEYMPVRKQHSQLGVGSTTYLVFTNHTNQDIFIDHMTPIVM